MKHVLFLKYCGTLIYEDALRVVQPVFLQHFLHLIPLAK